MMNEGVLVRGVFRKEALRFAFADTTKLCNDGVILHDADPAAAEVLCEFLTSAALTAVLLDGKEKYSIAIDYRGGIAGKWLADTDSTANVRALPGNTRLYDQGDRDAVFGIKPAAVSLIKFDQGKVLNSGEIEASMASPAQDLAMFFNVSDQVETEIGCAQVFAPDPAAPVKLAAGMMLQALPDCDLAVFAEKRQKFQLPEFHHLLLESVRPFEEKLRKLARFTGLDASPENFRCETAGIPAYHCSCNRGTMKQALMTLGKDDLHKLMQERGEAKMECRFCRKKYVFKPGDVL